MRFLTLLARFRAVFPMMIGPSGDKLQQVAKQFGDFSADLCTEQKNGEQRLERGVGVA